MEVYARKDKSFPYVRLPSITSQPPTPVTSTELITNIKVTHGNMTDSKPFERLSASAKSLLFTLKREISSFSLENAFTTLAPPSTSDRSPDMERDAE